MWTLLKRHMNQVKQEGKRVTFVCANPNCPTRTVPGVEAKSKSTQECRRASITLSISERGYFGESDIESGDVEEWL